VDTPRGFRDVRGDG